MKSKKAMSRRLMRIIIVLVVVLLLTGTLVPLMWKTVKSGLNVLGFDMTDGTETPTGPVLENAITAVNADIVSRSVVLEPFTNNYDSLTLKRVSTSYVKGYPLTIVFDREIKEFTQPHFNVKEWTGAYWKDIRMESFIVSGSKKSVTIHGFEKGREYVVTLYPSEYYEELNTKKKFQLNTANSMLKFQIS